MTEQERLSHLIGVIDTICYDTEIGDLRPDLIWVADYARKMRDNYYAELEKNEKLEKELKWCRGYIENKNRLFKTFRKKEKV